MDRSSSRRLRIRSRPGTARRYASVNAFCCAVHSRVSTAVPSSSQRYGSETVSPWRTSTTAWVLVDGYGSMVSFETVSQTDPEVARRSYGVGFERDIPGPAYHFLEADLFDARPVQAHHHAEAALGNCTHRGSTES